MMAKWVCLIPIKKYKQLSHVNRILLTIVCDTLKRSNGSSSNMPVLSRVRTRKNWSTKCNAVLLYVSRQSEMLFRTAFHYCCDQPIIVAILMVLMQNIHLSKFNDLNILCKFSADLSLHCNDAYWIAFQ